VKNRYAPAWSRKPWMNHDSGTALKNEYAVRCARRKKRIKTGTNFCFFLIKRRAEKEKMHALTHSSFQRGRPPQKSAAAPPRSGTGN
jgi:hypothetical protein